MERLVALRRWAGLSQAKLSKASEVKIESIRGYEHGRRVPRADVAVRIAQAIGCTVGQLLGTEPLPEGASQATEAME
jgi:transcriptional regulator with XRE-family HTH domain